MRLWVDDMRTPPDDTWQWATTSSDAVHWLQDACVYEISLDHDLGGSDTTRPIVLFMCLEDIWPKTINVHSCNPPGSEWLTKMCERYAPDGTHISRKPEWR